MFNRFVRLIITLYIVATVVFFILKLSPGSPISQYISPTFNQEQVARLKQQFGLDQPLHIQYFKYIKSISQLEFGKSLSYKESVLSLIGERIPNTLLLLMPTLLVSYIVGIFWGMIAGWKRGSKIEHFSIIVALAGRAAPTFWVGMAAIAIFSFQFGWLPSSGMVSPLADFPSFWAMLISLDFWSHLAMPLVVFSFYLVGLPFLIMRTGMLESKTKDFTTMHHYSGLRERTIMFRAARNSLLPVVTVIALGIGYIFEGAPVIETVFSWPGIGQLLVQAVMSQDYPLAQACFLIIATSVLFMNFVADILYGILDPRISTGRRYE